MSHNIIGSEVRFGNRRPALGGPQTGWTARRSDRRWLFITQGIAAGVFVLVALGFLAQLG